MTETTAPTRLNNLGIVRTNTPRPDPDDVARQAAVSGRLALKAIGLRRPTWRQSLMKSPRLSVNLLLAVQAQDAPAAARNDSKSEYADTCRLVCRPQARKEAGACCA